jgi:hypothetical protein
MLNLFTYGSYRNSISTSSPFLTCFASILPPHALFVNQPFLSPSYEAAEDNEISFKEGDRILEIEPASEDWWSGRHEGTGSVGLFPGEFRVFQLLGI